MRQNAMEYYRQGYGCSQAVLMAFEKNYPLSLSRQFYRAANGLNAGLGIGGTCGAVLASLLIFGVLFDANTVKRLRMSLFDKMAERGFDLCCARLRGKDGRDGCAEVVGEIAELIDEIIREEQDH